MQGTVAIAAQGLIRRFAWMLVALAWLTCSPGFAEQAGVDAVVVIDSSGSMKQTDPQRLRVPAAQLFFSLLKANDRGALISFSDNAYPVAYLAAMDDASNRRKLLDGTEKVSSKGAYTNLEAALSRALNVIERNARDDAQRYVVLLSDGHMDTGDVLRDKALIQRIDEQVLQRYRQANTKVYSIAFTTDSDVELLRRISSQTDGVFQLIENDSGLHHAFTSIFENAKQPNMLPIEGGRFSVDEAVDELTIVAGHAEGTAIAIQTPGGEVMDMQAHSANVRWQGQTRFDLITITKPDAGEWVLQASDDNARAYIVTDLKLESDFAAGSVNPGESLAVATWLSDRGEPLAKQEVIETTQFFVDVNEPDAQTRRVALQREAVSARFSGYVAFLKPGATQVTLVAQSPTFERRITRHVDVVKPVVKKPAAEPAQKPAPQPELKPTIQPVAAKTAAALPANVPTPPQIDLTKTLLVFAGINVALIIFAIAGWWSWKWFGQRRVNATEDESASAETETEAS